MPRTLYAEQLEALKQEAAHLGITILETTPSCEMTTRGMLSSFLVGIDDFHQLVNLVLAAPGYDIATDQMIDRIVVPRTDPAIGWKVALAVTTDRNEAKLHAEATLPVEDVELLTRILQALRDIHAPAAHS